MNLYGRIAFLPSLSFTLAGLTKQRLLLNHFVARPKVKDKEKELALAIHTHACSHTTNQSFSVTVVVCVHVCAAYAEWPRQYRD